MDNLSFNIQENFDNSVDYAEGQNNASSWTQLLH